MGSSEEVTSDVHNLRRGHPGPVDSSKPPPAHTALAIQSSLRTDKHHKVQLLESEWNNPSLIPEN